MDYWATEREGATRFVVWRATTIEQQGSALFYGANMFLLRCWKVYEFISNKLLCDKMIIDIFVLLSVGDIGFARKTKPRNPISAFFLK